MCILEIPRSLDHLSTFPIISKKEGQKSQHFDVSKKDYKNSTNCSYNILNLMGADLRSVNMLLTQLDHLNTRVYNADKVTRLID